MKRSFCLIAITFFQNVAAVMVGEGMYFYAHHELGFSDRENLGLALGRGIVFVLAALGSHAMSRRLGEKTQMLASLAGQMAAMAPLLLWPRSSGAAAFAMLGHGVCCGLKWPVIESYFSAGLSPRKQARAVGRFNITWSLAAPLGMVLVGPILASSMPLWLFIGSILLDAASFAFALPLESKPVHLPEDHPHRPPPGILQNYGCLMRSSRWCLICSSAIALVITPLLPGIFDRFAVGLRVATLLAALSHVGRFFTFVFMAFTSRWHGRAAMIWSCTIGLPLAFFMVMCGPWLPLVVTGQVLLGIGSGLSYFAALYYAMVLANASVGAGAKHEATIGAGVVVGPVAGLIATQTGIAIGSPALGMLLGIGPLLLLLAGLSAAPLLKLNRANEG